MVTEINIGNASYPFIILIPIIIILAALIFFIIYFIRAGKKIKKKEKPENISKEEENEEKRRHYTSYLNKTIRLRKKARRMKIMNSWEEFSLLVKQFFKEFLEVDYEFTYEELEKELEEKNKKEFNEFLKKLNIKYAAFSSKEELDQLILEFCDILREKIGRRREIKKEMKITKEKIINTIIKRKQGIKKKTKKEIKGKQTKKIKKRKKGKVKKKREK